MSYAPPTPQWVGGYADFAADVVATPDDGDIDLAWGSKLKRKYEGAYTLIASNALAGLYNRGVVSAGYVLDHSRATKRKGGIGRIELDWQSIGGYLNPDEWNLQPEDLSPKIERHPLFATLTIPDLVVVQQAYDALNTTSAATAYNKIAAASNPTLANQLFEKLRRGFETYYLSGYRYSWSQYYISGSLPVPNAGGTTYNAPAGPAGYILPYGMSWLRLADEAGHANWSPLGGIEKITYHWLGAPSGHWDPDIYPPSGS